MKAQIGFVLIVIGGIAVILGFYPQGLLLACVGALLMDPFRSVRSGIGIGLIFVGASMCCLGFAYWQFVAAGLLLVVLGYRLSEHADSQASWTEPVDEASRSFRDSTGVDFDFDD